MVLLENEEKAIIYGISKPFENLVGKLPYNSILHLWEKEIESFFFSEKKYLIVLSSKDEIIIKRSKDCYDKLKSLSLKNNIEIKQCFNLIL